MHLKKHIPASSLVEVVITISVIAICIGVSSLVFSRTMLVTTNFEGVKLQTELQSEIWKELNLNGEPPEIENTQLSSEEDLISDSLRVLQYSDEKGRILWKQNWLINE